MLGASQARLSAAPEHSTQQKARHGLVQLVRNSRWL